MSAEAPIMNFPELREYVVCELAILCPALGLTPSELRIVASYSLDEGLIHVAVRDPKLPELGRLAAASMRGDAEDRLSVQGLLYAAVVSRCTLQSISGAILDELAEVTIA
jgi:hypothetical protein